MRVLVACVYISVRLAWLCAIFRWVRTSRRRRICLWSFLRHKGGSFCWRPSCSDWATPESTTLFTLPFQPFGTTIQPQLSLSWRIVHKSGIFFFQIFIFYTIISIIKQFSATSFLAKIVKDNFVSKFLLQDRLASQMTHYKVHHSLIWVSRWSALTIYRWNKNEKK